MTLLELAKHNGNEFENAFAAAIAQEGKAGEAVSALAWLAGNKRAEQAEMLAWTWLSEFRQSRPPAEAADLARQLMLACPTSAQLRTDGVELIRASQAARPDINDWLSAVGLTAEKVSPQRALRALDLVLLAKPGTRLIDRTSQHNRDLLAHRVFEVVSLNPPAGEITIQPIGGGSHRTLDALRFGDELAVPEEDDFRILAKTDPDRLKSLLADEPLTILVSIIKAAGGQIDTEQLKDCLAERIMTAAEYSKWWSRARTAAKKSPNVRIEGRAPTMLIYDPVGVTLEQETLATLGKTWEPAARLAVFEGYLRAKAAERAQPDPDFLAEVAARVDKWMSIPSVGLGDALVAYRIAQLGAPVAPQHADAAAGRLAGNTQIVQHIRSLDVSLWPMALDVVSQALPAAPDLARPSQAQPSDWQSIYLQLLPHAPTESANRIAAALLDAGQADRLNAEIIAIVESPLESVDGLAWLWIGPARADEMQTPRLAELLDQLLWLAKEAETIAISDQRFAREIRTEVRGALSANGFARFREHVEALPAELAPLLRRRIRRADGLGLTVPETMLAILDERHPPIIEPRRQIDLWKQDDVIYVSQAAMAAKEKELDHITNVLMPANSRAISAAAARGDLSENSEYKYALEERDLLRARVARVQQELVQARTLSAEDVPADHVSIYSSVRLEPVGSGEAIVVQIVSPWDSDASRLRFNYKAPISQQFLGKRPGDVVTVAFEGQPERQFRIGQLSAVSS